MKVEDLDSWFKSNPRKSSVIYYYYDRHDGWPLARACERDVEMGRLANAVMKYVREEKAVAYQKFSHHTCEYIIKKI